MSSETPRLRSITTRLAVAFALAALVPLGVATVRQYTLAEQTLRHEVAANLASIADGRAAQLERFAAERRSTIGVVARTPFVIGAVSRLGDAIKKGRTKPEYTQAASDVEAFFAPIISAGVCSDVFLLNQPPHHFGHLIFGLRRVHRGLS